MKRVSKIVQVVKALVMSYIVTILCLALLAFGVYQWKLSETVVSAGIFLTYLLASSAGGMFIAKIVKSRYFIWGLLFGALYFLVLFLLGYIMYRGLHRSETVMAVAGMLCLAGGMLGSISKKNR